MNQERIRQVLSSIQERANKKFPKLFKTEQPDTDILFLLDKAAESPDIPKWKRDYFRILRKDFDKPTVAVDEDMAKAKDEYIEDQITISIKEGKLPPREEIKKYVQSFLSSVSHDRPSAEKATK